MPSQNVIHLKMIKRKSNPNKLFNTMLLVDGIPAYYSVDKIDKKETKFSYVPSYENLSYPLPAFMIWNDGYDWLVETRNNDFPERYIVEQAIEALNCYY